MARAGGCAGMGGMEGNEGARTFRVFSPAFVCSPQTLHVAAALVPVLVLDACEGHGWGGH